MELVIIARFHAREGEEDAVGAALTEQVAKARGEPGCISIVALRSTRDPRLYFHARLPNTDRFVERMEQLIDHPFEANRLVMIG